VDVAGAALLERVRSAPTARLKDTVNQALRQGVRQMAPPPKRRRPYRTPSTDLGPSLIGSLDSIGRVLAIAEGDPTYTDFASPQ
jgi:hypothetical protein